MEFCYSLSKRIFKGGEIDFTKNELDVLMAKLISADRISEFDVYAIKDILEA